MDRLLRGTRWWEWRRDPATFGPTGFGIGEAETGHGWMADGPGPHIAEPLGFQAVGTSAAGGTPFIAAIGASQLPSISR